jgi:SAM-dependent methyltransferase
MKDIVENRKRITLGNKLKLAGTALRENGLLWCALLLTYYAASSVADRSFKALDRLRRARRLPGLNSATLNKAIWEAWDWSASGDEWTTSPEWKQALVRGVLQREILGLQDVLEIGPGAGRWTGYLLERARRYIGVDISSTCVDHCRKRFGDDARTTFVVGSGRDLATIEDSSIDAIWSYDAFVHINATDVASYVEEFRRVLRPGAMAVIHHGGIGGAAGGWRSNLTADALQHMVTRCGLSLEKSLDHWVDADTVFSLSYGDRIAVIRKSAGAAQAASAAVDGVEG